MTFTDPLPPGLTVTALNPATRCSQTGATVSCAFGSLGSGGTAKVFISVRTSAPGPVTNTASVTSSTGDPDTADRSATASSTVTAPGIVDLRLTGTATPDPLAAGTDLTYTWTIADAGTAPATGVTFTHPVPAGVSVRVVRPGTRCTVGPPVTCSFPRIDPGVPMTVTELVRPASPGTLSITARVAGSGPDGVPGDESSTVTVTVNPPTGISTRLLSFGV